MAALDPGSPFPRVSFRDQTGASVRRPSGETLFVVFKTSCPTCELAWPYLERIRQAAEGGALHVLGVSQDDPAATAAFQRRLGSRVELVYDEEPWKASDRLDVSTVPTFFRVVPDGSIAETVVGFDRERMEGFARRAASLGGRPYEGLFRVGEEVPPVKPG